MVACPDARSPATFCKNLVLISIDTLRADHLGCYGYPRPTSPALDALAAQGVLAEVPKGAPGLRTGGATGSFDATRAPMKGQVVQGYMFNGGDPGDQSNWEKQ